MPLPPEIGPLAPTETVTPAPAGAASPARAPGLRRFRRMLYGTIGVFALLIVALVGANLAQGPRLTGAQINLATSVERTGQRLLLQANEPLSALDATHVTVTPAAALSATASASAVDIQFTDVLKYNTTYTVTVSDVSSIGAGAASTFSYSFTTPDPTVYVLVPGGGTAASPDTIVASPLSGGSAKTVYSAPRIRQFVAFASALVVNTVEESGADALTIVSLTGAADIPVQLAGDGSLSSLKSLPGSSLFGYTFTAAASPFYDTTPDQLYAYDLTRGQDYTIPLTGLDHEQLSTTDWVFVPGTTSLVARAPDGSALLIDTIGEREGTSGATTLATDDARAALLAPTAASPGGTTSPAPAPAPGASTPPAASTAAAATAAARAVVPDLRRLCLSPNGRYLAAFSTSGSVSFVDIDDGRVLQTTTGTDADWCGASS